MLKPVQQCTHCGAGLSIEDLRKPDCTYCGTVLPHHAQAAQHAQMIGQVMGQMMQHQPHINPYGDPFRAAHAQAAGVQKMVRTVAIVVGVVFALAVFGAVAIVLLVNAT